MGTALNTKSRELLTWFNTEAAKLQHIIAHNLRPIVGNKTKKRRDEYALRVLEARQREQVRQAYLMLAARLAEGKPLGAYHAKVTAADVQRVFREVGPRATSVASANWMDKSAQAQELRDWLSEWKPQETLAREEEQRRSDAVWATEHHFRDSPPPGFFPTPPAIAERMCDEVELTSNHSVLEPSAGLGHLADVIRGRTGVPPLCVERHPDCRRVLELKGYPFTQDWQCDVFAIPAAVTFDRVLLFPPPALPEAAAHLQRGFSLLSPAGRLAAIVPVGLRKRAPVGGFMEWLMAAGFSAIQLPSNALDSVDEYRAPAPAFELLLMTKPRVRS